MENDKFAASAKLPNENEIWNQIWTSTQNNLPFSNIKEATCWLYFQVTILPIHSTTTTNVSHTVMSTIMLWKYINILAMASQGMFACPDT